LIKNFKKSEAQKQLKFSEEGLLELSRIIDQLKERCVEAAKTLEEQQKEIDAIRLDLFECKFLHHSVIILNHDNFN
jgi:hypothetical protein